MKIQKKLFLYIGGCAVISSLLMLFFTFWSSWTFFTGLREDEELHRKTDLIQKDGLSVYYERQLFDSRSRNLMSMLERFAYRLERGPQKEKIFFLEALKKMPMVSRMYLVRINMDSAVLSGEIQLFRDDGFVPVSMGVPPPVWNFMKEHCDNAEPSLLYLSGVKEKFCMIYAFRTPTDLREKKISALVFSMKDDFLALNLGLSNSPEEIYFLYDGSEILTRSGTLPEGKFPAHLRRIFEGAEESNLHAEFLSLDDGSCMILASSEIATPCYGARKNIRFFHIHRYHGETFSFFKIFLSDYLYFLLIFAGGVLLGLFLLCLIILRLSRGIARPLKKIAEFADLLAQGEFPKEPLFLSGSEEWTSLSISLNRMRDRLNSQIIKLKRAHNRELEERRKLEKSSLLTADCMTRLSRCLFMPVSQISGFSNLLSGRLSETPDVHEDIKFMVSQIEDGLEKLPWINDTILEIGRYHQQKSQGLAEGINVLMLLRNIRDSFSGRALFRRVRFEIRYSNSMPQELVVDASLLKRTFSLMVSMILLSVKNGSTVSAGCIRENGKIVFWLKGSDRTEFPMEEIVNGVSAEKIPENFVIPCIDFRIVKEYASRMKGSLDFIRTPGESLDLRLSFSEQDVVDFQPGHSVSAGLNATQTFVTHTFMESPKVLSGGTVLFLEPDPARGKLVRLAMNRTNLKTLIASGIQEYYELIRKEHPEILLFDRETPGVDIHTLIFDLKQSFPHFRFQVLLLVGSPEESKLEPFRGLGVDHFLLKPIDFRQFYALLAHLLKKNR